MKILQLCTKVPFPPKDGGAAGVYIFSKSFAQLGHSVSILAVNPKKHFISQEALASLPPNIHVSAVNINTRPQWAGALKNLIGSRLPYQVERFIDREFTRQLIDILTNTRPDVIQLEGTYLCPYLPVIRKHSQAPVVLRAHNIEFTLWQNIADNTKNLLKHWYLNLQAQRLRDYELAQFSLVDGITTVTDNDLSTIKRHKPGVRAITIPFGVEPGTTSPTNKINTKAIFFLGALDWMPNQEAIEWFVHNAWPLIHAELPELKFHIAGRNAPERLSVFLQNTEGIVFHGEVPDAGAFINQFDIMVCPLFSGSGIRVKIIEAMQHGKVVIASAKATAGIPAVNGKHLLLAETPHAFSEQIGQLLSDPGKAQQISINASALVTENFNILALTSKLIEFYNQIHND
ncbi:MAG: glycosyltransferase family 4 protein [Bacteroidota bacterium]|nr:glycosyltransferase family 4 protein [Bacteroidota bacterium]